MARSWITDLNHFLEGGRLHPKLTPQASRLVAHLGAIVVAITSVEPDDPLGVRCRPRPGRHKCGGEIEGFIAPDTEQIRWMCLECGDNGIISNWQNTMWDCRDVQEQTQH